MIYQFRCPECNAVFERVQGMNDAHVAFHCNRQAMRIFTVPQTNKDLMYQFTTTAFGKPVDVHSRRQYKKLLKANGCADATISECLSVKPKDNSKQRIKNLSKEVTEEIYKKGAMDWVKGKVNSDGPDDIKKVGK